jgi:PhnB protein
MTKLNIYLTFNGNCEEAFNFYKSIFGGQFLSISKFKDMPPDPKFIIAESDKEKLMHVSLPISKHSVLMGSDSSGNFSDHFNQGNNFSISIQADSKKEANSFFDTLSQNGKITMPMANTFWGSYFGMCIDKYDIQWMVSFGEENPS